MDVYNAVYRSLKKGDDLVLVTVVGKRGSAPRAAGAAMIVRRDGRTLGTIGGGPIEAEAIRLAPGLFETRGAVTRSFALNGELLSSMDMVCGGALEFLARHVTPDKENIALFGDFVDENRPNHVSRVITELTGRDGNYACKRSMPLDAGRTPAHQGLPEFIAGRAAELGHSSMIEENGVRYWVEVRESKIRLLLFGAGHVAMALGRCALPAGFRVTVLDDRGEFASRERFPEPMETIILSAFEGSMAGLTVDDRTYIVIMTRGHLYDRCVLEQALATGAGYIGMIGSVGKREAIYAALRQRGFGDEDFRRVRCPVGVDIGAESPEEIAVSVTAELIAHRRRGV